MLRNNTRIIAFNPRFSKLVTKEYLEKLAGTRKCSTNQAAKASSSSISNGRSATPIVQPLEDDFTKRLGRTRNARLGRPENAHKSEIPSKLGHQYEYRRRFKKRSQSLKESRPRHMLSVLHEEEIDPNGSCDSTPRQSVDSLDETHMLTRTRNAKATGTFCRFVGQADRHHSTSTSTSSGTTSSETHKRQLWKSRPKGLRSRMVATLVVLKDHYQYLLSSLNGDEMRREYSAVDQIANAPKRHDLQFAEDLDLTYHDDTLTEYRSVKVRFKRSISCRI